MCSRQRQVRSRRGGQWPQRILLRSACKKYYSSWHYWIKELISDSNAEPRCRLARPARRLYNPYPLASLGLAPTPTENIFSGLYKKTRCLVSVWLSSVCSLPASLWACERTGSHLLVYIHGNCLDVGWINQSSSTLHQVCTMNEIIHQSTGLYEVYDLEGDLRSL